MWVKAIKEAIAVMLIALAVAGVSFALRSSRLPSGGLNKNSASVDNGYDAVSAVSLEAARSHFKHKTALFADARPLKSYASGHIQGALNLDPNEFDAWSGDFFSRVPPDQVIIAYCDGAQCSLSLELAEKLHWMGYEKVYYLENGWTLWKEYNLPVEGLAGS